MPRSGWLVGVRLVRVPRSGWLELGVRFGLQYIIKLGRECGRLLYLYVDFYFRMCRISSVCRILAITWRAILGVYVASCISSLLDPYLVAGVSVIGRSPFKALAIVMELGEATTLNPTSGLCALNHQFVSNY